jgi:hypothetical protein
MRIIVRRNTKVDDCRQDEERYDGNLVRNCFLQSVLSRKFSYSHCGCGAPILTPTQPTENHILRKDFSKTQHDTVYKR